MAADTIPSSEFYRGVPVHADQPQQRVAQVVRPEIDHVLAEANVSALAGIAGDVTWCPEARLLAAGKAKAIFELAVDERRERPHVDLDRLRASVAGLNSVTWRDPWKYCSLLDTPMPPGFPGAVKREEPLP
jgi:hypothetical protein